MDPPTEEASMQDMAVDVARMRAEGEVLAAGRKKMDALDEQVEVTLSSDVDLRRAVQAEFERQGRPEPMRWRDLLSHGKGVN